MAECALSFVGETIGNLLIDEAKYLHAVNGKVQDLQTKLEQIRRSLRNMDERGQHDQAAVVELQDIAYGAEDIIEQYILGITPREDENITKAYAYFMSKCRCVLVHEMGTKIDHLESRISGLEKKMLRHGIPEQASRPTLSYAHFEEDVVGREDDIEKLVAALLKDGKKHRVISIWGMDGLGKTALAKKVYAHDEVKEHFKGFAWVCVSKEYRVRKILENIFVRLIPDKKKEVTKMTQDELFQDIYKTQANEKCIVVLDDIWTEQAWNCLLQAFPLNNMTSKLLITTHNREVAQHIYPQGFPHQPQCLSDEESWEVLKMTFPEVEGMAENVKNLVDELLKKCGGFPGAINVLGRHLAAKKQETIDRNIISSFSNKMSEALALTYDNLPWHLKQCFLYLCGFPTDEEIPAAKVFLMWIAEGLVLCSGYDENRDVAEQYLMELYNRGMVQVRFSLSGKIKTCRPRNPLRDLCISKNMQEIFLSVLNIQQDDKVESTYAIRRLSLNMRGSTGGNPIPKVDQISSTMLKLRTLMIFHFGGSVEGMSEQFQSIFINCKFLRVLTVEDLSWMDGNLPESVGDLVLLKYLSLAGSVIKGLPRSMEKLVWMEFLDLRLLLGKDISVEVPNVLWKMEKLRHLYLPIRFAVHGSEKLRLDSLKLLRTLRNFCPKKCDVNHVGKHTSMQKFTVCKQDGPNQFELIPQLVEFTWKNLQSSSFGFSSSSFTEDELSKMSSYPHFCKVFIKGQIVKLPEHKNLPKQLRKLVLMDSQLTEDPMPILEKLQELVVLLLGNSAFVGKEMICTAAGFPQLKHLIFDNLLNLEEWRVAKGAMPRLSRLAISRCSNLKTALEEFHPYYGSEEIDHELSKYRD